MRKLYFFLCGSLLTVCGSPAFANSNGVENAVLEFVTQLISDDRAAAKALVAGTVNQTNQLGAIIPGGTYRSSSPFPMRIFPGRDEVSRDEAFQAFQNCTLWKTENLSADSNTNPVYQVNFMCQPPLAVFFKVKAADNVGKVNVFQLGRHPIFYSPPTNTP